jgi:hypothetical protein
LNSVAVALRLTTPAGVSPRVNGSGPAHTKFWKTRDGRKIRVCHMPDTHLLNTIRFMERQAAAHERDAVRAGLHVLTVLRGEMALLSVEQELDCLMEQGVRMPDIYHDMVEEATQRGLEELMVEEEHEKSPNRKPHFYREARTV